MKNQGFTLIELIVVIVILGILAATAAPKFIDLTGDAYTATLEGVKGSMSSASSMVHAKSIVKGVQGEEGNTVDIGDGQGDTLPVIYGYPDSQPSTWERLLELDENDFQLAPAYPGVGAPLWIYPTEYGPPITGTCYVEYAVSEGTDNPPDITLVDCE